MLENKNVLIHFRFMNQNWHYTYIAYHDSFIGAASQIRQSLFEDKNQKRGLIYSLITFS